MNPRAAVGSLSAMRSILRGFGRLLPTAVALALAPAAATAQSAYSCNPLPSGAAEASLMEYAAIPLAFGALEQPARVPTGMVTVLFELSQVPEAAATQLVTQCYDRDKTQNANLASLLPRPRLIVGLPFGLHAEGTVLPPVTVGDATPRLWQVALAHTSRLGLFAGNSLRLQLRGHLTGGSVEGPITCPASSLRPDPTAPCFGTEVSRDRFRPGIGGAEALLAVDGPGYGYYVGTGVNALAPSLQVNFTNGAGFTDTSRVVASRMTHVPLLLGGTLRFTDSFALLGQYYIVPGTTSLFRVAIGWRPRRAD